MVPYVDKDHYVKHDNNMLMVYYRKNLGGNGTKDRGDIVNVFTYMLNALSCELNENPDLKELSVVITQDDANNIITRDVINRKNKRINNITAVKEVLFNHIDNVKVINLGSVENRVIPYFQHVAYNCESMEVEIKFNSEFIEYFKNVKDSKDSYSKVTTDIMVSLGTLNAKILFAYICKYNDQITKKGTTNMTKIEALKQCFDKNYRVENGKMIFSIRNNDLEATVENSITQINTMIASKNKVYGLNLPQYQMEWYRLSNYGNGVRNGELTGFKIRLATEDELIQPPSNTPIVKENKAVKEKLKKEIKYESEIIEIMEYLNKVADKNFKTNSKDAIKYITQRLNEGYTVKDCKYVVDVMTAKWKNDSEMEGYLRPSTLFNSVKFEGYLNTKMPKQSKDHHHNNTNGWEDYGF